MHIYFSGIGGVGIGPLAEIAFDAGYEVSGSDREESLITKQLSERGIIVHIGQSGQELQSTHEQHPVDLFVYTAALPEDHPEIAFAKGHGIPVAKRDELLAQIIREKNLKLIAVAGTHGKTSTTGMLIWAFKQLGIPVSYSVGTTLGYGPSGAYDAMSEFFVYECDEYDRNMLHFEPFVTVITSLDYDHPDTYKNEHVYKDAFFEFIQQSGFTLLWEKDLRFLGKPDLNANYEAYDELMNLSPFTLAGDHVRQNAFLVKRTLLHILPGNVAENRITSVLNTFPGTGRRFEKLTDNLYSDYGHHPAEIASTLQLARELSDHVVLVYQPHQNIRQHEIQNQYKTCMKLAEEIYWLPTYLTREDPELSVLTPEHLSAKLENASSVHIAEMDDELWRTIAVARASGKLVLVMGAGSVDAWLRLKATKDSSRNDF